MYDMMSVIIFFGESSFETDGEYLKDAGGCWSDSSDLKKLITVTSTVTINQFLV